MQIDILTDPSCFETLSDEWHALLENAVTNHVFVTPEFQGSWWKSLGEGELHVVTFRNQKKALIGLAPLFVFTNDQGEKQFSLVGCANVSDYLDFIVHREYQQQVYTELVNFF